MEADLRLQSGTDLSQQRLRQSRKMEAVGHLAGGLAHDFNNLLGVILGYCELLEEQTDLPASARSMILEIHHAGASAKNLTQRLLAFSRQQLLQPTALDLNETVRRMQAMLGRLIGEDVVLVSSLSPGLGTIHADASQLEQVLMNLVINARDAMPQGGRISITTANVETDELHALQSPFIRPGQYVRLALSDTGIGMDAETQSHIFEPFFSTKPPDQGTGLGLSTVFDVVGQWGGAITVSSRPGHGTIFKIYFRRHGSSPVLVQSKPRTPVRGGTETILLVDDADALRRLTSRLLHDCGYTVLESADPSEALRIAEELRRPLPLMITDLALPGFSGSVLAEKLTVLHPETKVLYASGYCDQAVLPSCLPLQNYAFLEKPYTRDDLLMV